MPSLFLFHQLELSVLLWVNNPCICKAHFVPQVLHGGNGLCFLLLNFWEVGVSSLKSLCTLASSGSLRATSHCEDNPDRRGLTVNSMTLGGGTPHNYWDMRWGCLWRSSWGKYHLEEKRFSSPLNFFLRVRSFESQSPKWVHFISFFLTLERKCVWGDQVHISIANIAICNILILSIIYRICYFVVEGFKKIRKITSDSKESAIDYSWIYCFLHRYDL